MKWIPDATIHITHLFSKMSGPSVHGIFQAGILEWVAISYFGGSAQPGIKLMFSALEGEFFTIGPPGKSQDNLTDMFKFLF